MRRRRWWSMGVSCVSSSRVIAYAFAVQNLSFRMIEVGGQNYYRTLREKLGWRGHIRR